MNRTFLLFMVGLVLGGFHEGAKAGQSLPNPPTSGEKGKEVSSSYDPILQKKKMNQPLTAEEQKTYDEVLKNALEKYEKSGKKFTALSRVEQLIYTQNFSDKTEPTVDQILEGGLKYPWGIDIALSEARGAKLRDSIAAGSDIISSVVYTYQKLKGEIEKISKEKSKIGGQIQKLTSDVKEKLKTQPLMKDKVLSDEKTELERLQGQMLTLNEKLKATQLSKEVAISNIMAVTKLDREVVEKLPDLNTWKTMKANPETIPQKIQPAVLTRPRRGAVAQPPQQVLPQKSAKDEEAKLSPRPLPPLPTPFKTSTTDPRTVMELK